MNRSTKRYLRSVDAQIQDRLMRKFYREKHRTKPLNIDHAFGWLLFGNGAAQLLISATHPFVILLAMGSICLETAFWMRASNLN